jgi:hypothetical protein
LNQPISWNPLSSTKVFLTKTDPLGPNNQVALNVTAYNPGGGIANSGFWGVPLNGGWIYHFSIYIKGDRQSTVTLTPTPSCGTGHCALPALGCMLEGLLS